MLTESMGKIDARTRTINHEWGNLLIDPIMNHYDNQYDDYRGQGYLESSASEKAFNDATGYIVGPI
ncbi:hypothetical protein SAMN04490247_1737 [Salimicrobium halophilum]|uniref:Uncharacterized protein n=1 Tax=Salimicrobium halophilum TaxID=86666 RepID=A0A1G8T995_9BACI|nr:hypothetical protein SAMN04490247_1737 [Salimicrobium halophilum]